MRLIITTKIFSRYNELKTVLLILFGDFSPLLQKADALTLFNEIKRLML